MSYNTKIPHGPRLSEASDAGQKPPTEAMPVRQRYQMGCHPEGSSSGGGGSRRGNSYLRMDSKPRRGGGGY